MNEQGMDQVSTYDIARGLKIRQSNITYYFATKTDIINALAKRMIEEVDAVGKAPIQPQDFTFKVFYNLIDMVMKVHQRYRFIFMSYSSIITTDKELNAHFVNVLKGRKAEMDGMITMLDMNGCIRGSEMMPDSHIIMLVLNMLVIYWIQESELYLPGQSQKAKRRHHLRIFFQVFVPYTTEKGKKELDLLFSTGTKEDNLVKERNAVNN